MERVKKWRDFRPVGGFPVISDDQLVTFGRRVRAHKAK